MHAQIVADALDVPYESVEVAQPDTATVADSGPTALSRYECDSCPFDPADTATRF